MDDLPQEIVGDILLRLPVESLMRLCCVSKKLNEFIKSSYFVDLHSTIDRYRVLLLKGRRRRRRWWNFDDTNFVKRMIYLCNPTTRKFMALPDSSFSSNYAITHGVGFGFDASSDNYYVIRLVWFLGALKLDASTIHHDFEISSLLTDKPISLSQEELGSFSSSDQGIFAQGWPTVGAEMYSLNTNSWRKLDVVLPHIDERNSAAVLEGRYFHWCTRSRSILCFDVTSLGFRQMVIPRDAPSEVDRVTSTWNVGVLYDSLAFLFLSGMNVEVWMMEGYGNRNGMEEGWVKRYSIGCPMPSISIPSISCWNDGKLFIVASNEELISYHLKDDGSNRGRVIKEYGSICRAPNYSLSYLVYRESLVSLDRGHAGTPWRNM
ncbi:OLC1v1018459C1 [Oldenlandia corymbosa var. corymbosa]|uniref:OLC1v1018459C1 n=1 Tax=Oldenlandia corymbosa var. corymbosa TaxID=529605 RepID=A0AAV1EBY6_OLDCO|nr:OLC1v1018459C1 [Oldenlandia corymbosa var. corymbosa]